LSGKTEKYNPPLQIHGKIKTDGFIFIDEYFA
jgi:hypothetical protein